MADRFGVRVRRGDRLLGVMMTLPSAEAAEVLAGAGFDWLFIDFEHGAFEWRDVRAIIQAVGRHCPCVVRLASDSPVEIKRALDNGADGIIVPQVNSAVQAATIVHHARFPPNGARGVGLTRAHGYGQQFDAYNAAANDAIAVIVQAEHIDAVADIDAIAAVPGVDAVFIGPYDLSASLGVFGDVTAPAVVAAVADVTAACQRAGVTLGAFGTSAAAVTPYLDACSLIVAGTDTVLLTGAARALSTAVRTAWSASRHGGLSQQRHAE